MENQITTNESALPLFFTEDIFLVEDINVSQPNTPSVKPNLLPEKTFIEKHISEEFALENKNSSFKEATAYMVEKETILSSVEEPTIFKYLGGNLKSVLILVNDEQNEVSTEQGKALLKNIIKAINLSMPDFAILNYAHAENADFVALHQFFKPTLMLAFGVGSADLRLNIDWKNEILFHQTTRMIFAPNLHHLDKDLEAKKTLWGNLKQV